MNMKRRKENPNQLGGWCWLNAKTILYNYTLKNVRIMQQKAAEFEMLI